uniref:L1 transposable element RRM domain-containing protein n=1 Tax=Podarcis muralis TaxID=64176 RepID=A0A670IAP6_PODMU
MDKKIEETVSELRGQIKEVSRKVDEGLKKSKQEIKEMKREEEKMKNEIADLNRTQEELKDSIAMNELKQKEVNLRLRQVPETQNENIKERLIKEFARWMEMSEAEIARSIQNAFRMKSKTNKLKKFPGDCVVIFKDREMRNLILHRNREKRLYIDGNYIIIFKDIPIRLLKRREAYKPLVQLLKKNRIDFRWEFPEGVSFFYKGVKRRLTSPEEVGKFTRRYKELQQEEEEIKGNIRQ